jgi:glycosyltransferase involved in cell wall biosynthesis
MNGAVRHAAALSRELAGRGHEVLLLRRTGLDLTDTDLSGVEVEETSFLRWPGEMSRVAARLRGWGAEVLHTHMSAAHAYGAVLRTFSGFPTVATAHKRHLQLHWAFNDFVIAPSRATADYHRRVNLVPARKLVVIPNFLDPGPYPPANAQRRASARIALGLPETGLVVGSVGDITDYKRPSELVEACRGLLTEDRLARLVLVGGELDRAEAARLDRAVEGVESQVLRLGRRRDVPQLLPAFDLYAMASRAEEMPIAVLEAMATGLPVVGTDTGGMSDLVVEGETGFLVRPGDVAALAERISRLAAAPDLRRKMGEAGRARVLSAFAPGPLVDRIEQVLATAASKR